MEDILAGRQQTLLKGLIREKRGVEGAPVLLLQNALQTGLAVGGFDHALLEAAAFFILDIARVPAERTGILRLQGLPGITVLLQQFGLAAVQSLHALTQGSNGPGRVAAVLQIAFHGVQAEGFDLVIYGADFRNLPIDFRYTTVAGIFSGRAPGLIIMQDGLQSRIGQRHWDPSSCDNRLVLFKHRVFGQTALQFIIVIIGLMRVVQERIAAPAGTGGRGRINT